MTCESCGQPLLPGSWPFCDDGTGKHGHFRPRGGSLLTAIHPSERAVVYRNPRTGEIRYPARNDQPVPAVYARQGYERVELDNASKLKSFERATGKVHERSACHKGSATAEHELVKGLEAPRITGLDE